MKIGKIIENVGKGFLSVGGHSINIGISGWKSACEIIQDYLTEELSMTKNGMVSVAFSGGDTKTSSVAIASDIWSMFTVIGLALCFIFLGLSVVKNTIDIRTQMTVEAVIKHITRFVIAATLVLSCTSLLRGCVNISAAIASRVGVNVDNLVSAAEISDEFLEGSVGDEKAAIENNRYKLLYDYFTVDLEESYLPSYAKDYFGEEAEGLSYEEAKAKYESSYQTYISDIVTDYLALINKGVDPPDALKELSKGTALVEGGTKIAQTDQEANYNNMLNLISSKYSDQQNASSTKQESDEHEEILEAAEKYGYFVSVFMSLKEGDAEMEDWFCAGLFCMIGGVVGGAVMIICGIQLIITIAGRIFQLLMILPFAPIALSGVAGGGGYTRLTVSWVKSFAAFAAETLVIALAINLSFTMFSDVALAASITKDGGIPMQELMLKIVNMCIPMTVAVECCKGAGNIVSRAIGI